MTKNKSRDSFRRHLSYEEIHDVLNCKKTVVEMRENLEKAARPFTKEVAFVANKCDICIVSLEKVYQTGKTIYDPEISTRRLSYKLLVNQYGEDVRSAHNGYTYLLKKGIIDRKYQLTFKCTCSRCK